MFDRIAPHYDRLNRVLSFGTDLTWRRRATALARLGEGGRAVDVGAGTGDLTFALERASPRSAVVVAADLSEGMLRVARRRALGRGATHPETALLRAVIATAEALPFPDASLDRVVTGFTVRNVGDLPRALAEFRRVLRPGGRAVILELSHPRAPVFAAVYRAYFDHVAPRLAVLFGGDPAAYRYLPRSLKPFPRAEALAAMLRDAGFERVRFERLTFGIAAIHVAE